MVLSNAESAYCMTKTIFGANLCSIMFLFSSDAIRNPEQSRFLEEKLFMLDLFLSTVCSFVYAKSDSSIIIATLL